MNKETKSKKKRMAKTGIELTDRRPNYAAESPLQSGLKESEISIIKFH